MSKNLVLNILITLVALMYLSHEPSARAEVGVSEACAKHVARHHTTPVQDRIDHALGKQPGESPCETNKASSSSSRSGNDGDYKRRDRLGYHCGIFGCG